MGGSTGDFIAYDDSTLAASIRSAAGGAIDAGPASPQTRNREPSEDEIREALARSAGNVARAAKELGLSSRYALYRRLVKLGIEAGD